MAANGGIIFCSRIGLLPPMSGNGCRDEGYCSLRSGGVSLVGGVLGAAVGSVIMAIHQLPVGRLLVKLRQRNTGYSDCHCCCGRPASASLH